MRLAALLLLLPAFASAEPRLVYTKYFKGSVPEYVAITVERSGAATYQEAKDDDSPIKIQLSDSDTQTLFDLAQKLNHFQRPLESGLKVANMGTKTFAFEDGADKHRSSSITPWTPTRKPCSIGSSASPKPRAT